MSGRVSDPYPDSCDDPDAAARRDAGGGRNGVCQQSAVCHLSLVCDHEKQCEGHCVKGIKENRCIFLRLKIIFQIPALTG